MNISGVGIDIVDIKRFRKIRYDTNRNFYKKIFNPSEIQYCLKFKNPSEHFAVKFAIKEAVTKAIDNKISMLNIKTSHYNSKPIVILSGKLAKQYRFLVSTSHEKNVAIAVIISEKI